MVMLSEPRQVDVSPTDSAMRSGTRPGAEASDVLGRMRAVIDWILLAHRMAGDGGISKGYHILRRRWFPSYPETTGYTIPSLLNAAVRLGREDLMETAITMADFLIRSAATDGGLAHWGRNDTSALVFDTGQAIFGWLAAFRTAKRDDYLVAAVRAGDWLVSMQDRSGAWIRGQHRGVTKVIDTRVAWSLLELYRLTRQPTHRSAAVANLAWATQQQDQTGWFRHCALVEGEDPLTHTLAYTAEGLVECGLLLEDPVLVQAARRTALALLSAVRGDGSISATFAAGWRPTSRSSCLTGNCQLALLWMRLSGQDGDPRLRGAAKRAIRYVSGRQRLIGSRPPVHGAIPGSAPIYGRYERFKYPNWAAKFFLDALLALDAPPGSGAWRVHPG